MVTKYLVIMKLAFPFCSLETVWLEHGMKQYKFTQSYSDFWSALFSF